MTVTNHAEDPFCGASINGSDTAPVAGWPVTPAEPVDPVVDRAAPPAVDPPDDRDLLALVRAGQDAAFAELFARHAGAVRGYALRCAKDSTDAEDIAAEAFFRVLQAVRRGSGPEDNVRAYLFTVVRRLAAEWSVRNRDVPVTDEELNRRVDPDLDRTEARADQHLIARAFTSLPQRWRSVLWRVEVEGERPAVVAGQLGLSPNATAALARRAREGLRAAYLQAHVAPFLGPHGCRSIVAKLGAYTAGHVRGAEARRIRGHLASCTSCATLYAELADVCAGLRRHAGLLVPPVLVGAGLAGHHALAGSSAVHTAAMTAHTAAHTAAHAAVGSASLAGKLASLGARIKIAVAAVSMAAVGGLGVAVAPLLLHTGPNPHADYDHNGGLSVVATPPPSTAPMHPTTSKPHGQASTAADGGTAGQSGGAQPGLSDVPPTPSGSADAGSRSRNGPKTPPPAGRGQSGPPSVTQTSDPTFSAARPTPGSGQGNQNAQGNQNQNGQNQNGQNQNGQGGQHGQQRGRPTMWSTSYTTNGTTVWQTFWQWTNPAPTR